MEEKKNDNDDVHANQTLTEGCAFGTKGPLCSLCINGYNRELMECTVCVNDVVPIRIAIIFAVVLLLFLAIHHCRKRIQEKWAKYKTLWRDVLRIAGTLFFTLRFILFQLFLLRTL